MKKLHNKSDANSDGFTIIELLVFILVLAIIATVGVSNIRDLRSHDRDTARKTDVNAVYYQLESYYEKNGNYPEKLDVNTLKGIDPASLKDTDDKAFNAENGEYTYKPSNCSDSKCKSYEITAELEKEAPFTKESLNK
jgi:type II secretory pathway pseudopilin PulG